MSVYQKRKEQGEKEKLCTDFELSTSYVLKPYLFRQEAMESLTFSPDKIKSFEMNISIIYIWIERK